MYVITAASGKIGKALAADLLSRGKKVRVIGRDPNNLKGLVDNGAEAMIGDVTDASFVNRAFAGATAVFCLLPPSYHSNDFRAHQRLVSTNYANAVRDNHVKYAVLLSSVGAHLRKGAGVVDGLGEMEDIFEKLEGVNILILRPTYFMENLFSQIGTIKSLGVMGTAINGDVRFPIVASKDIAALAARRMADLDFSGTNIQYVLGPRDVSYKEIARVLGEAIGRPDLTYVQFSYEDAKKGMVASGFVSEDIAEGFNGLSEGFNNGRALNHHRRTPDNTTPTTLEEFAKVFAYAFSA